MYLTYKNEYSESRDICVELFKKNEDGSSMTYLLSTKCCHTTEKAVL